MLFRTPKAMEILLFSVEVFSVPCFGCLTGDGRECVRSPAPGHLAEGTTLLTAFIGVGGKHFMIFSACASNSSSNHSSSRYADEYIEDAGEGPVMIELTRLNGNPMVLNSDLI